MRRVLRTASLAGVLALVACAPSSRARPEPVARVRTVSVVVDNQYVEDVRVYLLRGDTPIPLGSVRSFERRSLELGRGLLPALADVRLSVRAMDGRVFFAEPVMAEVGDQVLWRFGATPEALRTLGEVTGPERAVDRDPLDERKNVLPGGGPPVHRPGAQNELAALKAGCPDPSP